MEEGHGRESVIYLMVVSKYRQRWKESEVSCTFPKHILGDLLLSESHLLLCTAPRITPPAGHY